MTGQMDDLAGGAKGNNGAGGQNERENRIVKLEDRLRLVELDSASRKPVSEHIKIVMYFWTALIFITGAFGFYKLSDIDKIIDDKVKLVFPRQSAAFKDLENVFNDAVLVKKELDTITKNYLEKADALKRAEELSEISDLEGQIVRLHSEVAERLGRKPKDLPIEENDKSGFEENQYAGTILDPNWRQQAIVYLNTLANSINKKNFDPDFINNAAMLCRQLDQFELAEKLTTAAYEKNQSPPQAALFYGSKVSNSTGSENEAACSKLMGLVRVLSNNSPQIILSEAWNAAERTRRYDDLIKAIEDGIAYRSINNQSIPSYCYVIMAQSLLREAGPGNVEKAKEAIKQATALLANETAYAQWYKSTLGELNETREKLELTESLAHQSSESESDLSDRLKLSGIAEVDRVTLGDGRIVKVGSTITVSRPTNTKAHSGWTDEMDQLARKPMTVTTIIHLGDLSILRVNENDKSWSASWVKTVSE